MGECVREKEGGRVCEGEGGWEKEGGRVGEEEGRSYTNCRLIQ